MSDRHDDELNRFWNELTQRGTSAARDLDAEDITLVRRLQSLAAAPLPGGARERVWRGLAETWEVDPASSRERGAPIRIDGAGRVRTLVSIVLPLSKPILVTVTTLAVVANWNSFLWPLIVTSSEDKRLLSVGIALFKGEIGVDYNAVMAGSLIALAPLLVLFVVFQRFIVRSVAVTGLK